MGIVSDLSIILLAALASGVLAVSLGLPPLIGYIAAGVLVGPHLGLVSLGTSHDLELFSEVGIALLLFSLGLEYSLSQLRPVKNIAVFGTVIQLALTNLIGFLLGKLIGFPNLEAFAFGAIISVSSTVVVIKNLSNLGLLSTLSARVMIGILIAQDIAVIPLMLFLPQLAAQLDLQTIVISMGKALIVIITALSFGTKLLPWFMEKIARNNSRELFIISVTTIALGVSYIGYLLGFSYAFGAFVAGMALSGSDLQHRALADIIPLRDLFVLLFFVSVGMMMDPNYIMLNAGTILLIVVAVMFCKAVIFYFICTFFKYRNVVPIAVGLGLCQIGEFSFALAQVGIQSGAITGDTYNLIVCGTAFSILTSPFLARQVRPIYNYLKTRQPKDEALDNTEVPDVLSKDYVVIIGGGRVGHFAATTLINQGFSPVVIEDNHQTAIKLKNEGVSVLFGDASNLTVLDAAKLEQAKILLIAIADQNAVTVIIDYLQRRTPSLPVIARAHSTSEMKWLKKLGVKDIVEPFFEAGLEMGMQALAYLGRDSEEIKTLTEALRHRAAE